MLFDDLSVMYGYNPEDPKMPILSYYIRLGKRHIRLDYQPLLGKGARAPPPKSLLGEERHERAAEIEPRDTSSCTKANLNLQALIIFLNLLKTN